MYYSLISCSFFAILLCVKFLKAINGSRLRARLKILQTFKKKKKKTTLVKLLNYENTY